jgi:hypothetical protein
LRFGDRLAFEVRKMIVVCDWWTERRDEAEALQ